MGSDKAKVKPLAKYGYGTGHVLNDMCASMWFTYMLLFFHNVIKLDNFYSGLIVLVGQIADGLSTVLVGVLSDKDSKLWLCVHYGKRKVFGLIAYHDINIKVLSLVPEVLRNSQKAHIISI